jgi:hypothetical protein
MKQQPEESRVAIDISGKKTLNRNILKDRLRFLIMKAMSMY